MSRSLRRWAAWAVVIAAALLSGLAQAVVYPGYFHSVPLDSPPSNQAQATAVTLGGQPDSEGGHAFSGFAVPLAAQGGIPDSEVAIIVSAEFGCTTGLTGDGEALQYDRSVPTSFNSTSTPADSVEGCQPTTQTAENSITDGNSEFAALPLTTPLVTIAAGLRTQLVALDASWKAPRADAGPVTSPAWWETRYSASGSVLGRYRQDVGIVHGEARDAVSDSFPALPLRETLAVGWESDSVTMRDAATFRCDAHGGPCPPESLVATRLTVCAGCSSTAEAVVGSRRATFPASGRNDTLAIVGWSVDGGGHPQPVSWDLAERAFPSDSARVLPLPVGKIEGKALGMDGFSPTTTESLLVAGWTASGLADTTAALWTSVNGMRSWTSVSLAPSGGRTRSIAHAAVRPTIQDSTFALIAGSSWTGTNRVATVWDVGPTGTASFDLNHVTDGIPVGLTLREATGIAYDGPTIAVSGWGTRANGDTLAFLLVHVSRTALDVPPEPILAMSLQAVPNPAPGGTRLRFALPRAGPVRLSVHDLFGRTIAVLAQEAMTAGPHEIVWNGAAGDGATAAPGLYFVRLVSAGGRIERQIAFMR